MPEAPHSDPNLEPTNQPGGEETNPYVDGVIETPQPAKSGGEAEEVYDPSSRITSEFEESLVGSADPSLSPYIDPEILAQEQSAAANRSVAPNPANQRTNGRPPSWLSQQGQRVQSSWNNVRQGAERTHGRLEQWSKQKGAEYEGAKAEHESAKSKLEQAKAEAKAEIKNEIKRQVKKAAAKRIKSAVKARVAQAIVAALGPEILIVIGIIIAIALIVFIVFMVVGLMNQNKGGDNPPDSSSLLWNDANLPSGLSAKKLVTYQGKSTIIDLKATRGRMTFEKPAIQKVGSSWYSAGDKGGLEFLSMTYNYTADEAKNYLSGRFSMIPMWDGSTKFGSAIAPQMAYLHQKIAVLSLKNKKWTVGVPGDWGPAPWAQVCSDHDSTSDNSSTDYTTYPNKVTCAEQRKTWIEQVESQRANYTIPSNFQGHIIGASPAIAQALGFSESIYTGAKNEVLIGFVEPGSAFDKVALGSSNDLTADLLLTRSEKNSAGLSVPGVEESQKSYCGRASIGMVATYYASSLGTNKGFNLSGGIAEHFTRDGVQSASAWLTTKSGDSCVSDLWLNNLGLNVPTDWTYHSFRSAQEMRNTMIGSVQGGDPFVLYTAPGTIYDSEHIVTVTGWDPATQSFIINNPKVKDVDVGVLGDKIGNKKLLTPEYLFSHRGTTKYGHDVIIRKKYIKK